MKARWSWMRILVGAGFVALLFPLGLIPVIVADTLLGDAEFLRQVLFVSGGKAAEIVVADWLTSLPFAAVCWLAMRSLSYWLGVRAALLAGLAVATIGIGFALLPPYMPMIFGTMVLAAAALGFAFDHRFANQ